MKEKIQDRIKGLLEKGEEIERIEKPEKLRFFIIQALIILLFSITISTCAMIEIVYYYGFEVIWAPLAVSAFCILVYMLFAMLYYRNIFYCITNKRLIIRSGIVGADYKAVEFKEVSKVEVKRIWFDKWFKRTTGTIILGSLEDTDIEQHFDEVGALFRLSGITNAKEIESLLNEKIESNKPQEEAKTSGWKSVKNTQQNKKSKQTEKATNKEVKEEPSMQQIVQIMEDVLESKTEETEQESKPKKSNSKKKK